MQIPTKTIFLIKNFLLLLISLVSSKNRNGGEFTEQAHVVCFINDSSIHWLGKADPIRSDPASSRIGRSTRLGFFAKKQLGFFK